MDEETAYTDEEIQRIAEGLAQMKRNLPYKFQGMFFRHLGWKRGPFEIVKLWSDLEVEAMTMKQKAIIVKVVGNSTLSADDPDYEKEKQLAHDRLCQTIKLAEGRGVSTNRISRSELEQMKEQGKLDQLHNMLDRKLNPTKYY